MGARRPHRTLLCSVNIQCGGCELLDWHLTAFWPRACMKGTPASQAPWTLAPVATWLPGLALTGASAPPCRLAVCGHRADSGPIYYLLTTSSCSSMSGGGIWFRKSHSYSQTTVASTDHRVFRIRAPPRMHVHSITANTGTPLGTLARLGLNCVSPHYRLTPLWNSVWPRAPVAAAAVSG